MAKIPAGAIIEDEQPRGRQMIPPDAVIGDESASAVAAAPAGGYEKSKLDRLVEAIKGAPAMLNQARTSLMTAPINLALDPKAELGPNGGLGSILRGQGEGFGYGFVPKLRGVDAAGEEALSRINPLESKGLGPQGTRPSQSLSDALAGRYNEEKHAAEHENDVSAQSQPGLYYGSQLGSAVAAPNPFGKLAALSTGSKLVNAGGRIASAAGQGALYTAGAERGGELDDYLNSVPKGALVGGALGTAGEVVAKGGQVLRGTSGKMAINTALGGHGQIANRLEKIGIDPENAAELGNKLIDEKLVPTGFSLTESPATTILKRSRALQASEGPKIGAVLGEADAAGMRPDVPKLQAAARASLGNQSSGEYANSKKANEFIRQIGEMQPGGDYTVGPTGEYQTPATFREANKQKSQAWDSVNFNDDVALEPKQYRRAVSGMAKEIPNQIGEGLGDEAKNRLIDSNRRFGIGATGEQLSKDASSRELQRGKFGTLGTMAMMAGGGAGIGAQLGHGTEGGLVGAGIYGLGQLAKNRGPAMVATGGRLASNAANMIGDTGLMSKGAMPSILDKYLNNDSGDEGNDPLKAMPEEERLAKGLKHFVAPNTGGGR